MSNIIVPALEEIFGQAFPIHGGAGFVRLVGYYGSDATIVQAARVSYGEGTKTVREDEGLINYLLKNMHTSPFEQPNVTFHIKQAVFDERQLGRHRMAKRNEISGRYSVIQDEFYQPGSADFRRQSARNKQVGEGSMEDCGGPAAAELVKEANAQAYQAYEALLGLGVARELARMVLPQNMMTEGYWQWDYNNLMKMLTLRQDWHAQAEIREIADVIAHIFSLAAPMTFRAYEEHMRYAQRFSRSEMAAIRKMLVAAPDYRQEMACEGMGARQAAEFKAKLFSSEVTA